MVGYSLANHQIVIDKYSFYIVGVGHGKIAVIRYYRRLKLFSLLCISAFSLAIFAARSQLQRL